jgi:Ca2+-binding RTX toxin-like protein
MSAPARRHVAGEIPPRMAPQANTLNSSLSFARAGPAGGTGPDRFEFVPGGFIPSVINGGGGGDTLDYSRWNAGVNVNLGAYGNGTYGYATGVGCTVSNIQNIIGSAYNDVLTGKIYGNVLVGRGGNDVITGGTGRSILIGGAGADTIHGRSGNDLIIGGYTSYDLNPMALDALFAEWDSSDSLSQRIHYLSCPVGHYNGTYFLIPTGTKRTVFDDGATDTITDDGGMNWIIPC